LEPIATANVDGEAKSLDEALRRNFLAGNCASQTDVHQHLRCLHRWIRNKNTAIPMPLRPTTYQPSLPPQTMVNDLAHNERVQYYTTLVVQYCRRSVIGLNAIFAVTMQEMLRSLKARCGEDFDTWYHHLQPIPVKPLRRAQYFRVNGINCARVTRFYEDLNRIRGSLGQDVDDHEDWVATHGGYAKPSPKRAMTKYRATGAVTVRRNGQDILPPSEQAARVIDEALQRNLIAGNCMYVAEQKADLPLP
jgi:hypothetical protein